ncbi:MAG TPA: lipid-binding SYLF domain-containing protein [Blastocatellia bacterium]|nr:lipid-binding SYLF domain-containing protein [Blastocatellia bacterium]
MKAKPILHLPIFCALALTLCFSVMAQERVASNSKTKAHLRNPQNENSKDFKDAIHQSEKAAKVFNEIMGAPDKAIPQNLIDKAECIAVFPDVIKAGFIVGGRGGRGVASCRVGSGWSAPAFFDIGGGSFGAQIGVESTDFVLLFMNKNGIDSLLSNKFEIGGEASVAAGPVGRTAAASTDAALNAQILSYSRSKGLFAGAVLKGAAITKDDSAMKAVYGEASLKDVLQDSKFTAPAATRAFPNTLAKYSARK